MATEAKLLRDGVLSDPTIWSGGVTPGPHDVAILDGQTLIIDMPWKVKELRADVYDLQWWDCVLKTSKGCTVEIGRLTIVGLPNDD